MIWCECELLFTDGKFTKQLNDDEIQAIQRYAYYLRKQPTSNIWYDKEEKVCFGLDQTWLNTPSRQSFFISERSNFLR